MGSWGRIWRDQRGFTLLEVLVTVGLIAFVYALFAVRTVGVPERRDVRVAASRMADDIRWIQHQALAEGRVWRLIFDMDTRYFLEPGTTCEPRSFPASPLPERRERVLPGKVKLVSGMVDVVFGCWGRREDGLVGHDVALLLSLWADDGTRRDDGTPIGYMNTIRVWPVMGRVTFE